MVPHDGSTPAVSIQRFQYGPGWTITVPADGKDHSGELRKARLEALQVWRELEFAFYRPMQPATWASEWPARPGPDGQLAIIRSGRE
jgi:hypothetical protein